MAGSNIPTASHIISNCLNLGVIKGYGTSEFVGGVAGGIIGRVYNQVQIINCANAGYIFGN